jgi:hypothetical protein
MANERALVGDPVDKGEPAEAPGVGRFVARERFAPTFPRP